jgi:medium-chain acyl-[acyl-carrier-protein] hydrolase
MRLFCFPYAGSGGSVFHAWGGDFPAEIEVAAAVLPGREQRAKEPPETNLMRLVGRLAESLSPVLDRPFAFFGHSLGALTAFELTRELRRRGLPIPRHLFVAARPAPQDPPPDGPLHQLPHDEFVAEVCRRFNGIPAIVLREEELMRMFVPILRADFALVETYRYRSEPPLDCPLTAFAGAEDRTASPSALERWREHTRVAFELQTIEGGHFFLQTARPTVTAAIRRVMAAEC